MPAPYTVRKAEASDIEAISAVHVQSWRETYPGIMPQQRIDGMSVESSSRHWQAVISEGFTFLVAETEGRVVGFASGGNKYEYKDCETGLSNACDCELEALYLLKEFQGRGIGKALVYRFAEIMKQEKKHTMIIWVAEKNPSAGFYVAIGGELVDRKMFIFSEVPVPVLAYRFRLGNLPV